MFVYCTNAVLTENSPCYKIQNYGPRPAPLFKPKQTYFRKPVKCNEKLRCEEKSF